MLPIDSLTEEAEALLLKNGRDPQSLYAAVALDKAIGGEVRPTFLALSDTEAFILDPTAGRFFDLPLSAISEPYIDSRLSSVRLLAVYTPEGEEARTVALSEGTNACRARLFIFRSVLEALLGGERMTGEETLFQKKAPPPPPPARGILRRMIGLFMHGRLFLVLSLLLLLLEVGFDLLSPYLSGTVLFDKIIAEDGVWHGYLPLFLCLGGTVASAFLRWGTVLLRSLAMQRLTVPAAERVRNDIFTKMQSMPISFFGDMTTGRLWQFLASDVESVRRFFPDTVTILVGLLEFIGVAVMLFIMNWKLSLLILVPVPIIFFIYRKFFPLLKRLNARAARENSAVSGYITNSLSGVRVVKAFSKEREEAEALAKRLDRLYKVRLEANLASALILPAVALLIYLANQAIWGFGGVLVMGGSISYGEFCTYLGYMGMVFGPLSLFNSYAMMVGQTSEAAGRIANLLDAVPDVQESTSPVALPHLRGEIEFSDVCFHYVPNRPILHNLSFRIEEGENIGLVGHTGSGKSTIASLLLRLYDVTGGSIKIDGHDVRELTKDTLRRNIAIVSQELHLFLGTIADNIRFGRPEASDEEVIAAARAAHAHEFIMKLPDGYETRVGRGSTLDLSGGERQRISIARAIVTQPRILILDEATAAMDNATERKISEALGALSRGRTTLSIAHRLSSLRDCDRMMVLEAGKLVEIGTREELLAKEGVFHRIYTLQRSQLDMIMKGETDHDGD